MKKSFPAIAIVISILLVSFQSYAQLLSWSPDFITEASTPVVITVDANKGNQGLLNYAPTSDVYVHTGVITNLSTSATDWRYVKPNDGFNLPYAALQATYIEANKWQFTVPGGIRAYYGVPAGETILKITFLFRNGNGSKVQRNTDASDMYIPVYSTDLAVRFTNPLLQPKYLPEPEPITKNIGDNIAVSGIANIATTLNLYFNGSLIQTAANATAISANPAIVVAGNQTLVLEANNGVTTKADTISFFVSGAVTVEALPPGVRDGINYETNTSAVTLVLRAPFKTRISVVGDFPGGAWAEQAAYQMKQTPDSVYWWIRLTGLTPGAEYAYQYLVDGALKIADPYAEKVLDPYADASIPASTYPSLKPYPTGLTTGLASIMQTAAPGYTWKVNNFSRPDKRNLLIYELLVRDFVATHDWKTLMDTLNYIKNLGINTIELMPFNEFEGNNSWGYNPDFYFAPDKYYGPANTLKEFIDSCHSKGIAVVMDIALNHSFGLSPMVQLYFDNVNNRPAANNPWFNPVTKHAFNVGYDMNHESLDTRYFTSRVVEHWLSNYKIDGFRFDLSKGFTQVATCDAAGNNCNVDAWGNYDASRVAIWKRYYDTVQLKSPGAYTILEHFAANSEEIELANYGMMFWGNLNYNYNEATMGYVGTSNFSGGIFTERGWTEPNLITYMESHDEERLMYKNLQFGNAAGSYNVKNFTTALQRQELAAAFFFTIPGPKMIWQFGETGYDYSINYCQNGTINNSCRTDPKPIRWDYLQDSARKHLRDVYSALMKLRSNALYTGVFTSNQITDSLNGGFKWLKVTKDISSLVVIGNFDVVPQTASIIFPAAGTWYDYLNGTTITATGAAQSFTLQPGEYHVYLNQNAVLPVTLVNFSGKNNGGSNILSWTANNEQNLAYYQLQRSVNGQDYFFVADLNASARSVYDYTDNIAGNTAQTFFYRLKSVDKDGRISYSAVIKLRISTNGIFAEVAPNPFKEKLVINIKSPVKDRATILLTDLSGRLLVKKNIMLSEGINAVELQETGRLSAGTYQLTIITSLQKQSIAVIKKD